MAHADAGGAEQQCEAKMDDTKPRQATHDNPKIWTRATIFLPSPQCQ
jgi:hypothetical protein